MATISNNPKFREQWSKFMHYFFDYLPTKYEATPREWDIRKLVWDFKDGKRSLQVAEMVARKIRMQFGATTGRYLYFVVFQHPHLKRMQRDTKTFPQKSVVWQGR